jgi:hypothetical protein
MSFDCKMAKVYCSRVWGVLLLLRLQGDVLGVLIVLGAAQCSLWKRSAMRGLRSSESHDGRDWWRRHASEQATSRLARCMRNRNKTSGQCLISLFLACFAEVPADQP